MTTAPDSPLPPDGAPARAVQRLPVEVRVLRGCGYCGLALMTEAEFLEWIGAPRDVGCPHCGTFTRRAGDYEGAL